MLRCARLERVKEVARKQEGVRYEVTGCVSCYPMNGQYINSAVLTHFEVSLSIVVE